MNTRRISIISIVLSITLLCACSSRPEGLWPLKIGDHKLFVEIAATPQARKTGLMYRETLPAYQGMLFVYELPKRMSFWMKNTKIPLDIAFIRRDGKILQIEAMEPLAENHRVSFTEVSYALEVNQGWFKRHGVRVGQKIENLPATTP